MNFLISRFGFDSNKLRLKWDTPISSSKFFWRVTLNFSPPELNPRKKSISNATLLNRLIYFGFTQNRFVAPRRISITIELFFLVAVSPLFSHRHPTLSTVISRHYWYIWVSFVLTPSQAVLFLISWVPSGTLFGFLSHSRSICSQRVNDFFFFI